MIKWILIIMFFLFFTALTQVGGLVMLLGLLLARVFGWCERWQKLLLSMTLYLITIFGIIPKIAPLFGRERIQHTEEIRPAT